MAILELLGSADQGLSLSTIVERTGLPMATTHRILAALTRQGYVEQDLRTRWYELGFKVLQLRGTVINQAMRMASEVRPELSRLSLDTGLRAHLAIYRGGNVVYIDSFHGRSDGSATVPVGLQADAHSTALGKVLLAFGSPDEVEALLRSPNRRRLTPNTIVDADELREELQVTRLRGYSVDRGEGSPDRSCIAAPVFDYRGHAVAAISIAGEVDEITKRTDELVPLLTAATRAASQRLGHRERDERPGDGASLP